NDTVVDRDALVHEGEVVFFETELAVLVQNEIDRLAVVLFHQLFESHQRFVESVVVVELNRAMERDRLLGVGGQRGRGDAGCDDAQGRAKECIHWDSSFGCLPRSSLPNGGRRFWSGGLANLTARGDPCP